MNKITWNPQVEEKFKAALANMPLFYRRVAEKMVRERAEIIAQEKNKAEISEEDMVLAFFKEVPGPFKGMMKDLLREAKVDYKKYVDEE